MKRLLYSVILLLGCLSSAMAEQAWVDVTDDFIKNPHFDNNSYSYWEGTPFGGYNPKENAEHYQKTYNTYQTLSGLKPGRYRLSVKAFYRNGNASNDYSIYTSGDYTSQQYAKLYASSSINNYETPIALASSGRVSTSLGGNASGVGNTTDWWGSTYEYYIPNDMAAAYYWFQEGYYSNEVECVVGSDGELTIGVYKDTYVSEDWSIFDDFKLEYYATVVDATSIELNKTILSMIPTQQFQFTAKVLPEAATYKNVTWSSSAPARVKITNDGLATASFTGTAIITATSNDSGKVTATCTVTVAAAAAPAAENIIINEVMASNVDVYRDPSTNFGPWVELYNPTEQGVKLGNLTIELTDTDGKVATHKLWTNYGVLPGYGFAVLNFDHHDQWTSYSFRQIDDKLDTEGGTIRILNGTTELASFTFPAAISRMSYARTTDGGDTWAWTGNPTPQKTNATSDFASLQLSEPVIDKQAQLFSGSISFKVTIPAGATLRYTTDGTAPTMENGETSADGNFTVTGSQSFRFRLFQDGMLPSPVVTRTFILNNSNEPFPIISLVTDPENIFEGDYAIFNSSKYGRAGNGQDGKCNWNMDWDRPVNFEYITTNNECVVSQEVDLSACGGWSRAWTPHSFKLKASKQYGINSLNYQFFPNLKPYLKHKVLQVRNGGNDNGCRIKDAALQQIALRSGLYVEGQAWQPVHVYLNGQPQYVINMREPNNKDYGYSNYGIDDDLMDQFEISPDSGYVQMRGTKDSFTKLYNLSKTASDNASYEEIKKLLDIDEYVNYMAVQLYLGGDDWPQNNVKGFRSTEDGKFRFVLFDLDHAFNSSTPLTTFEKKQTFSFNSLKGYDYIKGASIQGTSIRKELEFVTIFLNMLNNQTFKKKFIDAVCLVAGSVYTPERVNSIVDEMASYLSQGNYVYPSSTANTIKNSLSNRMTTITNHMKSYFTLGTPVTANISSNIEGAGILVNGMDVPTGQFKGRLFAPITLTAKAPAGYNFLGWKDSTGSTTETTTVIPLNSSWKYYTASLDGTAWKSTTYSDASWSSGTAPLGYGKSQNKTNTLTSNKTCYYFRKTITLGEVASTDTYTLDYTIDDGMVVYVNGQEAGRYNMPSGTPSYSTVATTYANGNPDTGSMQLSASLFKKGTNVIAVEVHNNSSSSSDILWEASLTRSAIKAASAAYVSTDTIYTMPTSSTQKLIAVWEKVNDVQQRGSCDAPVKINEVSAGNDSYVSDLMKKDDWVELYNTTDSDIDAAGLYLSDNPAKPTKFQIKQKDGVNTIIPAHGRLIVWCSKRSDTSSQIQASFKLANTDGSVLMLSTSDDFINNNKAYFNAHPQQKNLGDIMYYNTHNSDQSVGRYPDGGNVYFLMNNSTICKANTLQNADTFMGADDTFLVGDANGDGKITQEDANLTLKKYLDIPVDINIKAADVDNDGKIKMNDANAITNMSRGK